MYAGIYRGQKMVMDPLELELQRVVSCPPGLIETILWCLQRQRVLLTAKLSLQSITVYLSNNDISGTFFTTPRLQLAFLNCEFYVNYNFASLCHLLRKEPTKWLSACLQLKKVT